jgi:hypothetical protein
MFSPSLHTLLTQTYVDDRNRDASRARSRAFRRARPGGDAIGIGSSASGRDRRSTYRFVRHYAEMVVVMFAGMFVLMAPAGILFSAFGTSWSALSPAMNTFAMALTMTIPMVAWMRYRGHARRANIEMAASMLIPTFAVMGVLWADAAESGSVMVPEHAGMLACMLVAMLLRRDEYSSPHVHGHAPAVAAA